MIFNSRFHELRAFDDISLMFHWMGCTWWSVSILEIHYEQLNGTDAVSVSRWRPSTEVLAESGMLQWGHALTWGASIITGFVLYDVRPHTGAEIFVTFVALILGLMMNTVIISSTTSLLQSIDSVHAPSRQRRRPR